MYVSDLYSGKGWKHKVSQMPDDQITAIYLKHQSDGEEPEAHYEIDTEEFDVVFEVDQEPLVDIPQTSAGPHANEDKFPTY